MCKYIEYEAPWTHKKDLARPVLTIFIFPHPLRNVWDVVLVSHLLTIEVKKKEKRKSCERRAHMSRHKSSFIAAAFLGMSDLADKWV